MIKAIVSNQSNAKSNQTRRTTQEKNKRSFNERSNGWTRSTSNDDENQPFRTDRTNRPWFNSVGKGTSVSDVLEALIRETKDQIDSTETHLQTLKERHQTLITLKNATIEEVGEDE